MSSWIQRLIDRTLGKPVQQAVAVPARAASQRRVTIGLDFGTSSSKCCFREEQDGNPFVFAAFAGHGGRGSSPLFETAVSERGQSLVFGPEAAHEPSVLRSFKMCLPCQSKARGADRTAPPCPRCSSSAPGTFQFAKEWVSAEDLCSLHLSVILSEVLPRIPPAIGANASQVRVRVNVGAPLDQLAHFGSSGGQMQRVVFYALRMAEARMPKRCWPISDALVALRWAHQEQVPVEAESPTSVYPETHAAMTGYLLLPDSEKGLYGMLDIGAGTTDVSFFWFQKNEADTRAWYYATGTDAVGMDSVDQALASELHVPPSLLRAARESMNAEWLVERHHRFEHVSKRVRDHFGEIYRRARAIDQRDFAWVDQGAAQFQLFLVGGGAGCAPVVEICSGFPPHGTRWVKRPRRLLVPADTAVVGTDGSVQDLRAAGFEAARPLLLLAYGLAHPSPDIPKFDRDEAGVTVRKSVREPLCHEDLYD